MVHPPKLTAGLLSLLRSVRCLARALEIVLLPDLGLRRVRAVTAKHLRAHPTAAVLRPGELVQQAGVLRLPPVLPLRRAVPAYLACLLHVQPAIGLTREPVLHPALHDRLYRLADQA